jgi:small multidrug resistance pump
VVWNYVRINLYIVSMLNYLFLFLAIVLETAGTTLLKMSDQFTKVLPSIFSLVCYVGSLYLLSLCLRTVPIGIAYATWSALGIALITISGIFFFKQTPDLPAVIGLVLIAIGVAVLNLFSKMDVH